MAVEQPQTELLLWICCHSDVYIFNQLVFLPLPGFPNPHPFSSGAVSKVKQIYELSERKKKHKRRASCFLWSSWYVSISVEWVCAVCVSGRSLWRPTCATSSQTRRASSTPPSPPASWRCAGGRSCRSSSPASWWPWWWATATTTGRWWRRSVSGLTTQSARRWRVLCSDIFELRYQ